MARARARRAGFLPLSRKEKYECVRSLAQPCATFGWVGKKLPQKDTSSYDQTVWRAAREPALAGHWHKKLLLGPTLDAQIAIRQVLNLLRRAGRREWHPEHLLPSEKPAVGWLCAHGWALLPGRGFVRRELGCSPLCPGDSSGEVAHRLRESWRRVTWQNFTSATRRHEADSYRQVPYCSARFEAVRKTCYEARGPARWLMLGAVFSPLDFSKRIRNPGAAACPHCAVAEATWDHFFWQCSQGIGAKPNDPLQASSSMSCHAQQMIKQC